jgi:hypothetical protein
MYNKKFQVRCVHYLLLSYFINKFLSNIYFFLIFMITSLYQMKSSIDQINSLMTVFPFFVLLLFFLLFYQLSNADNKT